MERLEHGAGYDIVLNFAKTDKRIRMVTLEGSRTNTNIPPDDFQDFDITFFVTDMDSFTSDDKWLDNRRVKLHIGSAAFHSIKSPPEIEKAE